VQYSVAGEKHKNISLFVSLVYCAESTVRWFVVREKHCWIAADCADKSKRTGRWIPSTPFFIVLCFTSSYRIQIKLSSSVKITQIRTDFTHPVLKFLQALPNKSRWRTDRCVDQSASLSSHSNRLLLNILRSLLEASALRFLPENKGKRRRGILW
jgi:hypothetical protein